MTDNKSRNRSNSSSHSSNSQNSTNDDPIISIISTILDIFDPLQTQEIIDEYKENKNTQTVENVMDTITIALFPSQSIPLPANFTKQLTDLVKTNKTDDALDLINTELDRQRYYRIISPTLHDNDELKKANTRNILSESIKYDQ
jgi:hypothetical protein